MKFLSFRHVLIGLFMFAGAGLALALKPTVMVAQGSPEVNLEALIPKSFGDWRIDETIVPLIANPEQEALLSKIYSQTLTRTYVNSSNERIMLSIAYGGNQSDNMAVHKPEVCYPAQGFHIVKNPSIAAFAIDEANSIPVKRLVAQQGRRVEP
ncbi:MAG: exosortase C-terminal domain/associated protein EpsI, partial [Pseudomonadota bacterium]